MWPLICLLLLLQAAPWMMSQGVQLVCLGTGTTDLEVSHQQQQRLTANADVLAATAGAAAPAAPAVRGAAYKTLRISMLLHRR
jgi:glycogen synthase